MENAGQGGQTAHIFPAPDRRGARSPVTGVALLRLLEQGWQNDELMGTGAADGRDGAACHLSPLGKLGFFGSPKPMEGLRRERGG